MNFQFFWHKVCLWRENMTLYTILHSTWSIVGVLYILHKPTSSATTWAWCLGMIICPPAATLMLWLTSYSASQQIKISHAPHYNRLQRAIATLTDSSLSTRNHVTALHNADNTFSSIIRDIQHARSEIIFEYYIIDNDHIGSTIISLLCRRARAGVKVKIIYDAVGSWQLKGEILSLIEHSGIELQRYGSLRLPRITSACHRRNHRKIILIDRHILYLGGINIASRYMGRSKLGFWRDDHIRIEGETAHKAFAHICPDNKRNTPRRIIFSLCPMQYIYTSLGTPRYALQYVFQEMFASARHSIRISTPYFLPPPALLECLCSAAQSGVETTIIIPSKSDVALIEWASMPALRRCVDCGVNIYHYKEGFLHSKTIIIDDTTTLVGSINLDYRSIYYNLEVAAVIYNKSLAKHYIEQFSQDIAHSHKVTSHELQSHVLHRIKEGVAHLFAPLL